MNLLYIFSVLFGVVVIVTVTALLVTRYHQNAENPRTMHQKTKACLALIKSPDCGHCKAIAPVFDKLKKEIPDLKIVDGTKLPMQWYQRNSGVTGYPTVCLMEDDDVISIHRGPRTEEAIKAFYASALQTYIEEMKMP